MGSTPRRARPAAAKRPNRMTVRSHPPRSSGRAATISPMPANAPSRCRRSTAAARPESRSRSSAAWSKRPDRDSVVSRSRRTVRISSESPSMSCLIRSTCRSTTARPPDRRRPPASTEFGQGARTSVRIDAPDPARAPSDRHRVLERLDRGLGGLPRRERAEADLGTIGHGSHDAEPRKGFVGQGDQEIFPGRRDRLLYGG